MNFFAETTRKEKISCSELKVQDYKEILKCSYGDEPNKEIFIETLTSIFAKLSNKPQEYFKEDLSIFDLFLILLDIRIHSLGDAITIVVTKDNNQASLELRLDWIKEDIKTLLNTVFSERIQQNHISIEIGCPTIKKLEINTEEQYLYFLKSSTISERSVVEIETVEKAKALFDKLNPKAAQKIIDVFENFVRQLNKTNFLTRYGIEEQKLVFLPSVESLLWFTKLLFNEELDTFYDNLFYLSHLGHISLDYIENCSAGEYTYFVRKLEQTLNQKAPKDSSQEMSDEVFNNIAPDDLVDFADPESK